MKTIERQKYFLKAVLLFGLLIFCAGTVTACGFSSAEENCLTFRSDGTITEDFFADFPKERYNLTLFEEEAKVSVKTYNEQAGSGRIRLVSVAEKEQEAHVTIRYRSYEDYRAFNRRELYYGTVRDGLESLEFDGSATVVSPDGQEKMTLRELGNIEKNGEARWRIIAVCDTILVRHDGSPAYISSNAEILEDGTVKVNGSLPDGELPETAFIVYKK